MLSTPSLSQAILLLVPSRPMASSIWGLARHFLKLENFGLEVKGWSRRHLWRSFKGLITYSLKKNPNMTEMLRNLPFLGQEKGKRKQGWPDKTTSASKGHLPPLPRPFGQSEFHRIVGWGRRFRTCHLQRWQIHKWHSQTLWPWQEDRKRTPYSLVLCSLWFCRLVPLRRNSRLSLTY